MRSIEAQDYKNVEIIPVVGIKPPSKARNLGASKAKGEILMFIDDDALPGNEKLISTLVNFLIENNNKKIGLVGAEEKLHIKHNRFLFHPQSC